VQRHGPNRHDARNLSDFVVRHQVRDTTRKKYSIFHLCAPTAVRALSCGGLTRACVSREKPLCIGARFFVRFFLFFVCVC
jgi:hypothetical protein